MTGRVDHESIVHARVIFSSVFNSSQSIDRTDNKDKNYVLKLFFSFIHLKQVQM